MYQPKVKMLHRQVLGEQEIVGTCVCGNNAPLVDHNQGLMHLMKDTFMKGFVHSHVCQRRFATIFTLLHQTVMDTQIHSVPSELNHMSVVLEDLEEVSLSVRIPSSVMVNLQITNAFMGWFLQVSNLHSKLVNFPCGGASQGVWTVA